MDITAVLVKTRKGQEEIETRARKLPGRLRAVLIMIDGERTGADLLNQAGELAEQLEKQLDDLIKLGFLEEVGGQDTVKPTIDVPLPPPTSVEKPSAAIVPPIPVPAPIAKTSLPAWRTVPLDVLKARLGKMLNDSLGMRAMFLTAQLNTITHHGDLERAIDDMAQSQVATLGADAARKWRLDTRNALGIPGQ